MLKLFRSPRWEDAIITSSPFIDKLETWLKLAEVPYETVEKPLLALLEESPLRMVPYVDFGDGQLVAESNTIIDRLRELHNDPLNDARLTRAQHMQGEMLRSICEVDFLYIMVYMRIIEGDYKPWVSFLVDESGLLPDEEREIAIENWREWISQVVDLTRVGRYGSDFLKQDFRKKMEVFSHCLGDKKWLFGDEPSSYDAGFYGFMSSTVHFPIIGNAHVKISREYSNIVEYCDRVRKLVYGYDADER